MIKIYHNPRCRKSREGLALLEKSGKEFEVISYMVDIPTKEELREIVERLAILPEQLVRKNETIWKENYKDKLLTEEEVLDAMLKYPKLIERPIVIYNKKAVIGRPPENISTFLE